VKGNIKGACVDTQAGGERCQAKSETVGEVDAAVGDAEKKNFTLGPVLVSYGLGEPFDGGVNLGGWDAF
jgi:hypothetical protein